MLTVFYNGFNVIQIVDPINSTGVRLRKCCSLSQLAANTGNTRQNRTAGYSYTASSYHQTPCPALPCPLSSLKAPVVGGCFTESWYIIENATKREITTWDQEGIKEKVPLYPLVATY